MVDDAHLLPLASVRLLDEWLDEAPESLRVLLMSRWDLPITRLGAELLGHLTVLRGDLLRLDERDSATLVAEHARTDSAEVARAVTEYTHGWCAAVVLTARSIAAARDPLVAANRLRGLESPVADARRVSSCSPRCHRTSAICCCAWPTRRSSPLASPAT